MSVEDRAFNSQFERATAHSLPTPQDDAIDADFADFDKFFERLSSLDDLHWSSEPQERDIVPLKAGILAQELPPAETDPAQPQSAPAAPRAVRRRREARKPKAFFTTVMPKAEERREARAPLAVAGDPAAGAPAIDPDVQAEVDALPEIRPPQAAALASLEAVTGEPPLAAKPQAGMPPRKETVLPGTLGANGGTAGYAAAQPVRKAPERSRFSAGPVLKLAALGIVLFSLGMMGVWAALSLPSHLGRAMPRLAALLHQNEGALETVNPRLAAVQSAPPARMEEIELPGAKAAGSQERARQAATAQPVAPAPRRLAPPLPAQPALSSAEVRKAVAAAAPAVGGTVALPSAPTPLHNQAREVPIVPVTPVAAAPAQVPASPAATPEPAVRPALAAVPLAPAVAASAPVTAVSAGAGSSAPAAAEQDKADFAVQVGACSSATCVENYRTLLVQHVPSAEIQVIRAEGTAVQRVRVAPLTRSEAEEVKSMLAAADPRLQKAYVLTLH